MLYRLKILYIYYIIKPNSRNMLSSFFLNSQRNDTNHMNFYAFEQGFTIDEVSKIKEICDSFPRKEAKTIGNLENYRLSNISWIPLNTDTFFIYNKITELSKVANFKTNWNFDLWGFQDELQYTVYLGNGGHYDWHVDLGIKISNRKLSCVVQLSEPNDYAGGELQLNIGDKSLTAPKTIGSVIFFPSFILHRVTPVTSGVRKSLVFWISGSNFR